MHKQTSDEKKQNIIARGVRVNNLKNIDVEIPRNRMTVITGLSGSGKSSLAFDTLYAEGQRRYVESLSAYARQFLGRMQKPEADFIKGLPPAIAIEQKVSTRNPRSTVGTSTEIYEYLRLLFGRIGVTRDPVTGETVKKHTVDDVVNVAWSCPAGTRMTVSSPITLPEGRSMATQLEVLLKGGYSRLLHDGEFLDIAEMLASPETIPVSAEGFELLVDRLSVSDDSDEKSRLATRLKPHFSRGMAVWC